MQIESKAHVRIPHNSLSIHMESMLLIRKLLFDVRLVLPEFVNSLYLSPIHLTETLAGESRVINARSTAFGRSIGAESESRNANGSKRVRLR